MGAISDKVLERAIYLQQSSGVRLGSVLLEQDVVPEATLIRALARVTNRPAADWKVVKATPREIASLLPNRLAVRCHAVAFERKGRKVSVAMNDPNDLAALDEMSFVTGLTLAPFVLPEVRTAEALERFYGEPRAARLRVLASRLDADAASRTVAAAVAAATPAKPAEGSRRQTSDIWKSPAPRDSGDPIEISTWRPAPSADAVPSAIDFDMPAEFPVSPPAPPPPATVEELRKKMAAAESRDDIADAILDFLEPHATLLALFFGRKDDVIGWGVRGAGASRTSLKAIRIPFSEPSVFLNVRSSGSQHFGPIGDFPAHAALFEALGRRPEVAAVVPVLLKDRPVAFILAVPAGTSLSQEDQTLLRAAAAAMADAIGALILRQRKDSPQT